MTEPNINCDIYTDIVSIIFDMGSIFDRIIRYVRKKHSIPYLSRHEFCVLIKSYRYYYGVSYEELYDLLNLQPNALRHAIQSLSKKKLITKKDKRYIRDMRYSSFIITEKGYHICSLFMAEFEQHLRQYYFSKRSKKRSYRVPEISREFIKYRTMFVELHDIFNLILRKREMELYESYP